MKTERPSDGSRLSDEAYRALILLQADRGQTFDTPTASAMLALIQHLEGLLRQPEGTRDKTFYLSSLDPGKGKTEAVCAFLRAWSLREFDPSGGVLVAVSRVEEIASYIARCELREDDYAVLVSSSYPVGLRGRQDQDRAPVLFTTHEMVRRWCTGRRFQDVEAFHFEGSPRQCRVWDESMVLGRAATIRLDAIRSLLEPIRPLSASAAQNLDELVEVVAAASPGEVVRVPPSRREWSSLRHDLHEKETQHWDTLTALAGKEALIVESNYRGRELVGTLDVLPSDFAPALILDASGRVRHTYSIWEEREDNLVRLPAAVNDYSQLTIHHWNRPCSRSTFQHADKQAEILGAAAELINCNPTTRWLVLDHAPRPGEKRREDLLRQLVGPLDRVQFLHWGSHHGTNAYRDIDHILVLGLWHLAPSTYAEYCLASSGGGGTPELTDDDLARMEVGEHKHNLLQAICRGAVRNSSGGRSSPCVAYVIGRIGSDTVAVLRETFPGADVKNWEPVESPLTGQALAVAAVLRDHFHDHEVLKVRKETIRQAVGFRQSQSLAQVLKRPDVARWMAAQGLSTSTRYICRARHGGLAGGAKVPSLPCSPRLRDQVSHTATSGKTHASH